MLKPRTSRRLWATAITVIASGLIGAALLAYRPSTQAQPKREEQPSKNVSVMTDSVNYMLDREVEYTLYDLSKDASKPKAIGGGIVSPLISGGEKGCCLSLPRKWQPGMKVRVEWGEADQKILPERYSRELEIPAYDKPSDLYVVFYPKHEVEVVVSFGEPGHPEWRGRMKKAPWEQCVADHGRKPCKAALPKVFDAGAIGLCTYMKEKKAQDAEENCAFAMNQCMQDYEDELFCRSILWGPIKK